MTIAPQAAAAYRYLLRIIARYSKDGALVFRASLEQLHAGSDLAAIEAALRTGRAWEIESAVKLDGVADAVETLRPRLSTAQDALAQYAAEAIAREYGAALDLGQLRLQSALAARAKAARLVTVITEETRDALRDTVARNIGRGRPWQEAANEIRRTIGLNRPQAASLAKYTDELAERSDLSPAQRERMIERERKRLVKQRAKTIALTEVSDAANNGQTLAWRRAQAEGVIPRDVRKQWILSAEPCRDVCIGIGEQIVGIDDSFIGADGTPYAGPPAHPNCLCGQRLVRPELD